ncbi:hypothetical protein KY289_007495 [Solanum tuberosum]|nr:hypothetical protein KY289_007495 [Solanum tuberosum]
MIFSRPSNFLNAAAAGVSSAIQMFRSANGAFNSAEATPELYEADMVVFLGDLNYRLDGISYDEARDFIYQRSFDWLRERDQLHTEMEVGNVFQGMRAAVIRFPPTYKFKRHQNGLAGYDFGEKKRIPAWCDRILYRDSRSTCSLDCPVVSSVLQIPEAILYTNNIILLNSDGSILRITNKSWKNKAIFEIICQGESTVKDDGQEFDYRPRGSFGFPRWLEIVSEPYGWGVWRVNQSFMELYGRNAFLKVGNGNKIKFWRDGWIDQIPLSESFPDLFSICNNPEARVCECWTTQGWDLIFRRLLNDWKVDRVASFLGKLGETNLVTNAPDRVIWKHSKDDKFTVNSAYKKGIQVGVRGCHHHWKTGDQVSDINQVCH